ncbi:unnamed protein product [Didymodactylos carnosus]|uniref:Uncharacterized protein n=1 Tax=Didymodactylos carnosus TaxID=1234261 RepID=A0A814HRA9_9BILA|nr:unnamed protein product [Didymodactylos carnosus]CAF3785338.1 unnamed protein product [Didymodactylos carnosus]
MGSVPCKGKSIKEVENHVKKRDTNEGKNKQGHLDRGRKIHGDHYDKKSDQEFDETDEYVSKRRPLGSQAVKNAENTSGKHLSRLPPINPLRSTSHTQYSDRSNSDEEDSHRHRSMSTTRQRYGSDVERDTYRRNRSEDGSADHFSSNESATKSSKKKKFIGKNKLYPSEHLPSSSRTPVETKSFRSPYEEFAETSFVPKTSLHAGSSGTNAGSWSTTNTDKNKKMTTTASDNEDYPSHSRLTTNTRTNNNDDFRSSPSYSRFDRNKSPVYDVKKPSSTTSVIGTKTNWTTGSAKRPHTTSGSRFKTDSDSDEKNHQFSNKLKTYSSSRNNQPLSDDDDVEVGINKTSSYSSNTLTKKPPMRSLNEFSDDDTQDRNKFSNQANIGSKFSDNYTRKVYDDDKKYTNNMNEYNRTYNNSSSTNKNNNSQSRLSPLVLPSMNNRSLMNSARQKPNMDDDEGDMWYGKEKINLNSEYRGSSTKQNRAGSDEENYFDNNHYNSMSTHSRYGGGGDRDNTLSKSRYDEIPSRYMRNSDSFPLRPRPNADTESGLR